MEIAKVTPREFQLAFECKDIAWALAAPTLRMAQRSLGNKAVYVAVSAAITKGMNLFAASQRLHPDAVTLFADMILEKYPHESLDDLVLFLRRAALGTYGEVGYKGEITKKGETYGELTLTRLATWWTQYLDEKAQAREQEVVSESGKHKRGMLDWDPRVLSIVKDVTEAAAQQRADEGKAARLHKLHERVPHASDEELIHLRDLHLAADEAMIVQAEMARRGLLGEELQDAQVRIDAETKRRNEAAVATENDPAQLAISGGIDQSA